MQNQYIIEHQQLQQGELCYYALPHTIIADTTSNRQFFKRQLNITAILFLIVLLLKALPSPIIINTIENDPQAFTKELCEGEQECSSVDEGYESIIIKKINSFQRQLKYFVKLNYQKYESLSKYFNKTQVDLNNQITWIEIYASRNGQTFGQVLYEKSGGDIYEILFDNRALIFVGQIHILEEQSYIIQIYKLIKTFKENREKGQNLNFTYVNLANQQNNSSEEQQLYREIKISIPLTVQIVRYSQFYTVVELIVRYVSLFIILYVRSQTSNSPAIFHYLLILTSNPIIFIEIAFPNTFTNLISTVCSSMYYVYLAIFLYYSHKNLQNRTLDLVLIFIKLLFFFAFWVTSILRQLHLVNHSRIQLLQTILMLIVLLPLFNHLWALYFFKSKTIVHRNVLFVALTLYFLLLFFFSGYLVNYGWMKISTYLIVQIYGCELCFLTAPFVNKDSIQQSVKYQQIERYESSASSQENNNQQQKNQESIKTKIGRDLDSPEDNQTNSGLYIKVL